MDIGIKNGLRSFTLRLGLSFLIMYGSNGNAQVTQATQLNASPRLPMALSEQWQATGLPQSALSLVVQEINGPRLLEFNAHTPRNPASVMKLVTTWLALSTLGPHYTWQTELSAKTGIDSTVAGTFPGTIYLRASGDPSLKFQDIRELLRELQLRGIKHINDIVIDRGIFGDITTDSGEFDAAPDRPYNASPDAFMVGQGVVRLLFIPHHKKRTWTTIIDPPLSNIKIAGQLQWDQGVCRSNPRVQTELFTSESKPTLRLKGKVSGECGEFSVYRLILSQSDFAESFLRLAWKELGGTLKGKVYSGVVPPNTVALVSHTSSSLTDMIRIINKNSNNVMTKLLLLTVGAERGYKPATVNTSHEQAMHELAGQGLYMPELVIDNGSGLSRQARISVDSLAKLLTLAWNSVLMPEYVASLPLAGIDGTLNKRMRGYATQGRAHLKTGSLRDVRALAGYVMSTNGKRYIVASIINASEINAANQFNDALIQWVSQR